MGSALENMPLLLQQRIIGATINYILREDMGGSGFITQDVIEELFRDYTGASLKDAFQLINTTFKDFIDEHFSMLFKNCYPHGLARLSIVDKPESNFDNFGAQTIITAAAISSPPSMKAIQDDQRQSDRKSSSSATRKDALLAK